MLSIPKTLLTNNIGILSEEKLFELKEALTIALEIEY
jgi:hypothetical protein